MQIALDAWTVACSTNVDFKSLRNPQFSFHVDHFKITVAFLFIKLIPSHYCQRLQRLRHPFILSRSIPRDFRTSMVSYRRDSPGRPLSFSTIISRCYHLWINFHAIIFLWREKNTIVKIFFLWREKYVFPSDHKIEILAFLPHAYSCMMYDFSEFVTKPGQLKPYLFLFIFISFNPRKTSTNRESEITSTTSIMKDNSNSNVTSRMSSCPDVWQRNLACISFCRVVRSLCRIE